MYLFKFAVLVSFLIPQHVLGQSRVRSNDVEKFLDAYEQSSSLRLRGQSDSSNDFPGCSCTEENVRVRKSWYEMYLQSDYFWFN